MMYDLLEQPWLPVRRTDGGIEHVGLRAALRDAHHISGLVGDIATQELALVRLMLAVLLRAYRAQLVLDDKDGWAVLWRAEALPEEPLLAYLEEHSRRFDLLDTHVPFLQVADLRTAKDTATGVVALLPDVRNNERLFSTRAGTGLDALPTPEAARWLVACHAFDPSGIKSGAVGDPRVRGGKGYPIGTGWAGQLGLVLVQGRTLRETLLLNLARPQQWRAEDDLPVWERAPLGPAPEGRPRAPTGPADTYTWPSRRIRLLGDEQEISRVVVCNGDPLTPQDRQVIEPMTAWRHSALQAKKLGRSRVFMPRRHDPDRALWRGLAPLLEHRGSGGDDETVPPHTLAWMGRLRSDGLLAPDYPLVLRAVGMTYGSQSAVETGLVDDALGLPSALLGRAGRPVRAVALEAVERADLVGAALGQLARNLARAAGGEGDSQRSAARGAFFFALEPLFAPWLLRLPQRDLDDAQAQWQASVGAVARGHARRLLDAASPASWTGREVGPKGQARLVNAFLADHWFRASLAQALPRASAGSPAPGTSPTEEAR